MQLLTWHKTSLSVSGWAKCALAEQQQVQQELNLWAHGADKVIFILRGVVSTVSHERNMSNEDLSRTIDSVFWSDTRTQVLKAAGRLVEHVRKGSAPQIRELRAQIHILLISTGHQLYKRYTAVDGLKRVKIGQHELDGALASRWLQRAMGLSDVSR